MFKRLLFISLLLLCVNTHGQNLDPLRTDDYFEQEQWVDSILSSMSIDQKIGQLFMVQTYSNLDSVHENKIKEMIQKYHIGNLIFMQGTPRKQAQLTNIYQSLSTTPLMIGFDGEWGLDMRLQKTYRFPWNMTLGAIQDNTLIHKFGEHLGRHANRMGIHVNFAPVVDINTNPRNPIIGNRSFGENKKNVTQKAIAFSKGMQSVGVLANAKHFPGHGDTATDSHLKLPVLNFDRQRLDSVELYPYKKVFDAGMSSVMTAHLSIPVLEPNPKLPTSLSSKVVTDLLKYKLGFLGLIFTDGLNMKGAANYSSPSEINLAAILAGNDILLIPHDIPETINLFKTSIQSGVLSYERIDESVRKILLAKYKVGLHTYKPIELLNLEKDINTSADEVLHRELVKNSMTLIKNKKQLLPISDLRKFHKIAYVALGDDHHDTFFEELQKYSDIIKVEKDNLNEIIDTLEDFDLVIVGFHKSNAHPWKPYQFSNKEAVWLHEISRKNKTILSVFTSPYSLLNIKSFNNLESILIAYQNSDIAQKIAAQTIFGAIDAKGVLPISIKNKFPEGTGILTKDLKRLQYSIPESVGMSSIKLKRIDSVANLVIEKNMAPGLQVLVARHGVVIYEKSFGFHTDKKVNSVKSTDVYDVASLTKILASLPMMIKAEEENKIKFNKLLLELVPDMEKYIVKRMRTAIQQEHFPKNKYKVDDFIDQLFIEIYDQIEQFSNEYEFYVWIYKKTNELLDDAITEETFDDLFLKNIDDYSKQEWDQMREKFTAEYDGDLIMKEDLNDISYYKEAYTLKDIFIENTEDYLEAEIDEILHEEEVDKHIQIVLHNLPLPMQNVFELFTKQHRTIAEIAEIRNISIVKAQQLLNDARKSLKISLFNRYTFDSETLFIDES